MQESAWGWLIITYLFLAGAGSGAFLAAVACDLWRRTGQKLWLGQVP